MDNLSKEQRLKNMRNIRSKNSRPERIVAKELRKRKVYFAQHSKDIIGKPDFVFKRKKVAIFIDSEFWHGHPTLFKLPKSNVDYWKLKIENNKKRDCTVNQILKDKGWRVIRFWVCEINSNLNDCIETIIKSLNNED